jgi:putative endonuclease
MTNYRQRFGAWGEKMAEEYLEHKGYAVLAHNIRTPYGEIDLLARQEATLVFVEVKTRSTRAYGLPEESLTLRKQAHILDSSRYYLQKHPEHTGDWRVDVIAIQQKPGDESAEIIHFENAFN